MRRSRRLVRAEGRPACKHTQQGCNTGSLSSAVTARAAFWASSHVTAGSMLGFIACHCRPPMASGATLEDDPTSFWSSTGSLSPDACEYLLYKLK